MCIGSLRFGRREKPIVSFSFDDFPRSAWTVGGSVLGEYGVHGTYYVAMGLMGNMTPVGEMFEQQDLDSAAAAGHELACHTHDHALCADLSPVELEANCKRNRVRMAEVLRGFMPRNFSFPEGVVNASAKATLKSVYDSCRTIEPGINHDPVDLGFLRANPVYSTSSPERLFELIRENQRLGGWLILYTHDIGSRPSPWGCTPQQFRAVVERVAATGAEMLSVAETMERFSRTSQVA